MTRSSQCLLSSVSSVAPLRIAPSLISRRCRAASNASLPPEWLVEATMIKRCQSSGLGIIEAFLGRELDGYAHQLEGGEVSPGEFLGRPAVDDRPHKIGEHPVPSVRPLRRGCEAEGVGREEHLRDDRVLRGRQVVYLVVDDERKAVPVALGVDVRRVVSGHREGRYLMVAAAEQPDRDRTTEGILQNGVPLLQQCEGRNDDERAPPYALYRAHGYGRLPGTGRQHDHAPEPIPAPGAESLLLVGAGLHGHAGLQRDLLERRGPVFMRNALGPQAQNHLAVGACRSPPLAGPSVPDERLG